MNDTIKHPGWPDNPLSASSTFGKGWELCKKWFLELFIITIIVTAAFIPVALANDNPGHGAGSAFMKLFAFAFFLFLYSPIEYGAYFAFIRGSRGDKPEVNDIFKVKDNYLNVVLAKLVTLFIIGFGFAFLIIPGIYLACKLVFVPYLVVDRDMEVTDAIRESWEMTKGQGWTVFRMGVLCIPVVIGGLMLCGIGVVFSVMWIDAAFASLYTEFDEKKEQETPVTTPQPEHTEPISEYNDSENTSNNTEDSEENSQKDNPEKS